MMASCSIFCTEEERIMLFELLADARLARAQLAADIRQLDAGAVHHFGLLVDAQEDRILQRVYAPSAARAIAASDRHRIVVVQLQHMALHAAAAPHRFGDFQQFGRIQRAADLRAQQRRLEYPRCRRTARFLSDGRLCTPRPSPAAHA